MSKDAEGNGYSPLAGDYDNCTYLPETTYSGDIYDRDYTAKDHCMEDDEWNDILAMDTCVLLIKKFK